MKKPASKKSTKSNGHAKSTKSNGHAPVPLPATSRQHFERLYQDSVQAQMRLAEFVATTGAALGLPPEMWVFELLSRQWIHQPPEAKD
jgi:hypothetical protein